VLVPYSNHHDVARPRGSTVPLKTADVDPTDVTAAVTTWAYGSVVNATSAPLLVPRPLRATSRKWYVVPGLSFVTRA
jgi:hypothetical protein